MQGCVNDKFQENMTIEMNRTTPFVEPQATSED